MAFSPRFGPQAPGAVAAFAVFEYGEYFRFPGRFTGLCRLRVLIWITAVGCHVQYLAPLLDVIINVSLVNERQRGRYRLLGEDGTAF